MPLSSDLHALRDPAAPRRLGALVLAAVVLWPLFQGAGFSLGALFDPGNLQVIGRFLATFLPPGLGRQKRGQKAADDLQVAGIEQRAQAEACALEQRPQNDGGEYQCAEAAGRGGITQRVQIGTQRHADADSGAAKAAGAGVHAGREGSSPGCSDPYSVRRCSCVTSAAGRSKAMAPSRIPTMRAKQASARSTACRLATRVAPRAAASCTSSCTVDRARAGSSAATGSSA